MNYFRFLGVTNKESASDALKGWI